MNIKIAELEITSDEKLYGSLIQDLENIGYIVIQNNITTSRYIIARKEDKE